MTRWWILLCVCFTVFKINSKKVSFYFLFFYVFEFSRQKWAKLQRLLLMLILSAKIQTFNKSKEKKILEKSVFHFVVQCCKMRLFSCIFTLCNFFCMCILQLWKNYARSSKRIRNLWPTPKPFPFSATTISLYFN